MTADANGNIGIDFGLGGVSVSDNRRIQRLFKIVSGTNPYTANEVWLRESDGATAVTGLYQVTSAQKQLWEVNGNTSVAANTIVDGVPNPAGNGFWFSSPSTGTASVITIYESTTWSTYNTTSSSVAISGSDISLAAGTWLVQAAGNTRIQTTVVGDYFQCTVSSGTVTPDWNTIAYPCQVYNTGIQNLGDFCVAAKFTSGSSFSVALYAQHFITGAVTVSQVLAGRTWAIKIG